MDRRWLPAVISLTAILCAQPPEEKPEPVLATFKGTRLYNFHTTETAARGHLEFRVAHRFGDLTRGYATFWGLDAGAQVRLSLDYGVTDYLTVGLERSGVGRLYDAFVKVRLLRQKVPRGTPFSLTYYGAVFYSDLQDGARYPQAVHRFQYLHQLLAARKVSSRFSALAGIAWLHQNYALSWQAPNDYAFVPVIARFKLTKRLTLAAETALPLWENEPQEGRGLPDYRIPYAVVLEVETGGHVFQIGLSNAAGIAEPQTLLTQGYRLSLGFNISRIFSLYGDPSLGY
ncbi:MAG: hypothetical protein KatS3mg026_1275 [Bacteroidia bacterium]|nr:MAG: hypothetical protein KatS3mg026_1275 [Bacteroidia bacterium]